jgi:hypothetical protein
MRKIYVVDRNLEVYEKVQVFEDGWRNGVCSASIKGRRVLVRCGRFGSLMMDHAGFRTRREVDRFIKKEQEKRSKKQKH